MQGSLESKNKREAYAAFEEQGRLSTWVRANLSSWKLGKVHSCFLGSMNLEFDGQMLHLDSGRQGLCCFGINVTDVGMQKILAVCRPGDLVVISGEILRIYGRTGLVCLDLRKFDGVDLSINGMNAGKAERMVAVRLKNLLESKKESRMLGIEKTSEFLQCAEILAGKETDVGSGCKSGNLLTDGKSNQKGLVHAVSYLYGRGLGLTPAGDDILVGYWSILQSFSGSKSRMGIRAADRSSQLAEVIARLSSKTTDVSRAYLSAVQAGYANEVLVCLFRELRDTQSDAGKQLLLQLEGFGHTSGCDTIYGMHLGLRYICEKEREEYS